MARCWFEREASKRQVSNCECGSMAVVPHLMLISSVVFSPIFMSWQKQSEALEIHLYNISILFKVTIFVKFTM